MKGMEMKKGFSAGKVILFFFGIFVVGVVFIFIGINNRNNFLTEVGNAITLWGIIIGFLILSIALIWKVLRG